MPLAIYIAYAIAGILFCFCFGIRFASWDPEIVPFAPKY